MAILVVAIVEQDLSIAERTIAVTGATGFLGRYICAVLLKHHARVVGTLRSPERGADLADQGVVLRPADLLDAAALHSAFQGVDAIVANAALISANQPLDFIRVNVDGMANLLHAAVEANVRRLIVVSTVSIYRHNGKCNGEHDSQIPYTEKMLQRKPYGATKARAEALAWEAAQKAGLEVTTVRPGYIYGRGARIIGSFRAVLAEPVALIPCYRRIPLAYAGDIAEAIVRCLQRPVSIGRAYNLTGHEDWSWRDFTRAWAQAGGPIARVKLPIPYIARHRYRTSRAETDLEWRNTNFVDALTEILADQR